MPKCKPQKSSEPDFMDKFLGQFNSAIFKKRNGFVFINLLAFSV